jgi:hypothetical protein
MNDSVQFAGGDQKFVASAGLYMQYMNNKGNGNVE